MNYLETRAEVNRCRCLSHHKWIPCRSNRNAAILFVNAVLLCILASLLSATPLNADDATLPQKVIAAVKEKRGYSNAVAVSVDLMRPAAVPGFLTAEISIKEGQDTRQGSVSISRDGRFYTEGPLIPLHSGTHSGTVEALKAAVGSDNSDIAITEAVPWMHKGFRHGYVYSIVEARPTRMDYYLADDGSALVLGTLYYLYRKDELSQIATADSHVVIGSPSKQSVLVLFSDFQCPFCAELEKRVSLADILRANPFMTIVLRNYPLPYHSWARVAALANTCVYAAKPEKYLDYREQVFSGQNGIRAENAKAQLMEIAAKLGFDTKPLEVCMASESANKAVDDDIRAGDTIQLSGTPAGFLDGIPLPVAWTIEDLHPAPGLPANIQTSGCRVKSQSQSDSGCKEDPRVRLN
jgi:hypothetical protein